MYENIRAIHIICNAISIIYYWCWSVGRNICMQFAHILCFFFFYLNSEPTIILESLSVRVCVCVCCHIALNTITCSAAVYRYQFAHPLSFCLCVPFIMCRIWKRYVCLSPHVCLLVNNMGKISAQRKNNICWLIIKKKVIHVYDVINWIKTTWPLTCHRYVSWMKIARTWALLMHCIKLTNRKYIRRQLNRLIAFYFVQQPDTYIVRIPSQIRFLSSSIEIHSH